MRRSKIKEEKVAGQYQHLGDPSKKVVLRAGGVMHSSEDGKPRENEGGTWSVKTGEVHISVDGDNFIFEIKGNGNLQVVALLDNGVREDAPERIKKGFILKRIIADSDKPNNELLDLKQLKSIKVALWTLVTVFVILPVITGLVIGFIALTADDAYNGDDEWSTSSPDWGDMEDAENASKRVEIADPIVEKAIRVSLRKFAGELTEADLERVKTLEFINSSITNEGVKEAAKLKQLEKLSLSHTKITDECLKEVAKLPRLKDLGLWDTRITDAGLKEVAKLTQLEVLNLGGTKITNRGLKNVSKLTKLTYLNLRYISRITDAGLKELAKLEKLEHLYLGHTQITDTAELQKALPKCEIGD